MQMAHICVVGIADCMKPGFTITILLAVLAASPGQAASTEACAPGIEDASAFPQDTLVSVVETPGSSRFAGSIEFICEEKQLVRLDITLPAGSRRGVVLLAGAHGGQPVEARMEEAESWSSLALEPLEDRSASRLVLDLQAPRSAAEGTVLAGRLRLFDSNRRSGKALATIAIRLTVRGEAPLFRDQFDEFEVDPVIGQFSQVH